MLYTSKKCDILPRYPTVLKSFLSNFQRNF